MSSLLQPSPLNALRSRRRLGTDALGQTNKQGVLHTDSDARVGAPPTNNSSQPGRKCLSEDCSTQRRTLARLVSDLEDQLALERASAAASTSAARRELMALRAELVALRQHSDGSALAQLRRENAALREAACLWRSRWAAENAALDYSLQKNAAGAASRTGRSFRRSRDDEYGGLVVHAGDAGSWEDSEPGASWRQEMRGAGLQAWRAVTVTPLLQAAAQAGGMRGSG